MKKNDGKTIFAVDALGVRTLLHTTYVAAWTPEGANKTGRFWLQLFCRGQRFSTRVREATPTELGCVPASAARDHAHNEGAAR